MTVSSSVLQGSNIVLQRTAVERSGTWSNPSLSRSNHRDDVKFISTRQEMHCRISLSKIMESSATFAGTNDAHGWIGLRFQLQPDGPLNDVLVHVNMRDMRDACPILRLLCTSFPE